MTPPPFARSGAQKAISPTLPFLAWMFRPCRQGTLRFRAGRLPGETAGRTLDRTPGAMAQRVSGRPATAGRRRAVDLVPPWTRGVRRVRDVRGSRRSTWLQPRRQCGVLARQSSRRFVVPDPSMSARVDAAAVLVRRDSRAMLPAAAWRYSVGPMSRHWASLAFHSRVSRAASAPSFIAVDPGPAGRGSRVDAPRSKAATPSTWRRCRR